MILVVAGLILVHGHVENPVQAVLHAPVRAGDFAETCGGQCRAEQIVSGFGAGLSANLTGADDLADGHQALTVTHIFLLWAKDLISLADPAALGGRARERTCSMKPVMGPRPSSGRPTLGMPDAPTVS